MVVVVVVVMKQYETFFLEILKNILFQLLMIGIIIVYKHMRNEKCENRE